ncbi:hypothetical protein [Variovorax sp. UMC13]|nr:hypothetical protein [Variovorax sp. UMC13]
MFASLTQPKGVTMESDVAQAIWRAATEESDPLHYPAGAHAVVLALMN